ncbi:MAG TPA: DKNYY domain-containing protein [Verrucomicrobiales bacterium]|nr:DKNYY domain-containing protein [Verrucomicrobiales bacterium]
MKILPVLWSTVMLCLVPLLPAGAQEAPPAPAGRSASEDGVLEATRDNLYKNAKGDLFFRSLAVKTRDYKSSKEREARSFMIEAPQEGGGFDGNGMVYYYRNFFGYEDITDLPDPPRLRDTIDFKTWTRVSQEYYIDSKHVYFASSDSGGGYLCVVDQLSPNGMQFFHQGRWQKWDTVKVPAKLTDVRRYYVSDGKNVYFGGSALNGVDAATFRVLEIADGQYDDIGADKNGMFRGYSKWTNDDYKAVWSNILDEKGKIINKGEENMNWIKAYNRVASDGMRIATEGK